MAKITESMIQKALFIRGNRDGKRLFRNNVGVAFTEHGRVEYGLRKGSADLIGWETIEITEEMIGKKIAVFLSVEVKTETGKTSKDQELWFEMVKNAGGKAIIARKVTDL